VNYDAEIDCIDCGGRCSPQVNWRSDDQPIAGDVIAYRCEDCLDVWYLVVPDVEDE
jgi:hypothetical protein